FKTAVTCAIRTMAGPGTCHVSDGPAPISGDPMNPVLPAAVACAISLAQASANGATLQIHTTAAGTADRLAASSAKFVPGAQPPEGDISVFVDPGRTFQTLLGIGGAITDASAEVFARLSPM